MRTVLTWTIVKNAIILKSFGIIHYGIRHNGEAIKHEKINFVPRYMIQKSLVFLSNGETMSHNILTWLHLRYKLAKYRQITTLSTESFTIVFETADAWVTIR